MGSWYRKNRPVIDENTGLPLEGEGNELEQLAREEEALRAQGEGAKRAHAARLARDGGEDSLETAPVPSLSDLDHLAAPAPQEEPMPARAPQAPQAPMELKEPEAPQAPAVPSMGSYADAGQRLTGDNGGAFGVRRGEDALDDLAQRKVDAKTAGDLYRQQHAGDEEDAFDAHAYQKQAESLGGRPSDARVGFSTLIHGIGGALTDDPDRGNRVRAQRMGEQQAYDQRIAQAQSNDLQASRYQPKRPSAATAELGVLAQGMSPQSSAGMTPADLEYARAMGPIAARESTARMKSGDHLEGLVARSAQHDQDNQTKLATADQGNRTKVATTDQTNRTRLATTDQNNRTKLVTTDQNNAAKRYGADSNQRLMEARQALKGSVDPVLYKALLLNSAGFEMDDATHIAQNPGAVEQLPPALRSKAQAALAGAELTGHNVDRAQGVVSKLVTGQAGVQNSIERKQNDPELLHKLGTKLGTKVLQFHAAHDGIANLKRAGKLELLAQLGSDGLPAKGKNVQMTGEEQAWAADAYKLITSYIAETSGKTVTPQEAVRMDQVTGILSGGWDPTRSPRVITNFFDHIKKEIAHEEDDAYLRFPKLGESQ